MKQLSLSCEKIPEFPAFLDRNIREFAVCSATLTDWKASRLRTLTVMEFCSLRFGAKC
jgi:hypothetical protein